MTYRVETYKRDDGKNAWRIYSGDDIVATDGGQGYNNLEDALSGLFGIFFGAYDDSFLDLYAKWQGYAGQQKQPAPEPYVRSADEGIAPPAPEGPVADATEDHHTPTRDQDA